MSLYERGSRSAARERNQSAQRVTDRVTTSSRRSREEVVDVGVHVGRDRPIFPGTAVTAPVVEHDSQVLESSRRCA